MVRASKEVSQNSDDKREVGMESQFLNLNELRNRRPTELMRMARSLNIDEISRMSKQDLIYAILRAESEKEGIIYASKSQIRSFHLKTGDTVGGQVRLPREGEKNLALLKIEHVNYEAPEVCRDRVPFESLVPLHPEEKILLEYDHNEFCTRVMDLFIPVGKG